MGRGVQRGQKLRDALQQSWSARSGLGLALLPVALAFGLLAALRRQLYRWGVLPVARVPAFVIVVGNVIAGGAGKTPTVISVVQHLSDLGVPVGVVSRGYGRSSTDIVHVQRDTDPQQAGDEPLHLHRATGRPVVVGANRVLAANALLARHPDVRVLVCDDGLQHYALHRDCEVCVFDDRGIGNGWLLPSGPLREPWPMRQVPRSGQNAQRLLVLHTGAHPAFAGYRAHRSLAPFATTRDHQQVALEPALLRRRGKPLLALAAIAQPEAFFAALRALGLPLEHTQALPDHHVFDAADVLPWQGYQILCTEKDAPKLWPYAPDALCVGLVQALDADFLRALDTQLAAVLPAPVSSRHGHETA